MTTLGSDMALKSGFNGSNIFFENFLSSEAHSLMNAQNSYVYD